MKRPWLLSTKGQRFSILLSLVISVGMTLAVVIFAQVTMAPREQISQLNPAAISYCELSQCTPIESLGGLELVPDPDYYMITEGRWFTTVTMRFLNQGQLNGDRELRLMLRSSTGTIVEMAKQVVNFHPKGRMFVDFTFTGSPAELRSGTVYLGY
ncbi:MAG: hypothetical protein P8M68_02915 [Aquiluna sp.]|nr:hypothetical protein [Aquiluna sp.]